MYKNYVYSNVTSYIFGIIVALGYIIKLLKPTFTDRVLPVISLKSN